MKSLAEQVRSYMDWRSKVTAKDFSASDMAADVGRHQTNIVPSRKCTRQNIESIFTRNLNTTRYMVALAQAMGTTVETLAAGKYSPPSETVVVPVDQPTVESGTVVVGGAPEEPTGDLRIPEFNTGGAMGKGVVLRDQPGVIHSWNVSQEWARQNLPRYTSLQNLAIVTGFGPSMRPLFNPGDPLVVDLGVNDVELDAIYFFRVGEEGFIKHIQRVPNAQGGVDYTVISENDRYKPWTITKGMDFEVFGKILKVWKGEEC